MFTVQDDDGIAGSFEDSDPHTYSSWGYFTILYPVMESLGLKATVSLEGRRAGFTASPPALNHTDFSPAAYRTIADGRYSRIPCIAPVRCSTAGS